VADSVEAPDREAPSGDDVLDESELHDLALVLKQDQRQGQEQRAETAARDRDGRGGLGPPIDPDSAFEDKISEQRQEQLRGQEQGQDPAPEPPVVAPRSSVASDRPAESGQALKPEQSPEPNEGPDQLEEPRREKSPEPGPSPWDEFGTRTRAREAILGAASGGLVGSPSIAVTSAAAPGGEGSVIRRLRRLRGRIPALRGASGATLAGELDAFREPWARRRALVALIEAGVPADPEAALALIESLDRPMDRRWCLSTLATRGDLSGDDLERALALLSSPAARRRVAGLAAG